MAKSITNLVEKFSRNIDASDKQIDRLVYELAEEEIRIVEKSG